MKPALFLCAIILLLEAPASSGACTEPTKDITASEVTAGLVGTTIPSDAIGEPVSAVSLAPPRWVEASTELPAHAIIDGSMAPVDPKAKPIHFRIVVPASWTRRAAQLGGGGFNGSIPQLAIAEYLRRGFATYGSDSGHQTDYSHRPASHAEALALQDWALNDEVARNFGYMQMKKTHDAAMVLLERIYGERPRFNYYIGNSQGGREALTVAQRYPADYDGILATVPVVNLSTLMLAPSLVRVRETRLAAWVPPAKATAIAQEFMRQADGLDGLMDGVINNYMAARARFDLSQGDPSRNPWAALQASPAAAEAQPHPSGAAEHPADAAAQATLSPEQVGTLNFIYSRHTLPFPLANGVSRFGMWLPSTDPAGGGMLVQQRFKGQEGASGNAPVFASIGSLGVTGFMMRDLEANPLDFDEQRFAARRRLLSEWLDSTNPDLSRFHARGGKLLAIVGTNDMIASPGAQLDYFQAVIDTMGRERVDSFARFWVLPQTGHGLSGRSHSLTGEGKPTPVFEIPSSFDRLGLLIDWVENLRAPDKTQIVTAGGRSLPLASYPNYPHYIGGPPEKASSYRSTSP